MRATFALATSRVPCHSVLKSASETRSFGLLLDRSRMLKINKSCPATKSSQYRAPAVCGGRLRDPIGKLTISTGKTLKSTNATNRFTILSVSSLEYPSKHPSPPPSGFWTCSRWSVAPAIFFSESPRSSLAMLFSTSGMGGGDIVQQPRGGEERQGGVRGERDQEKAGEIGVGPTQEPHSLPQTPFRGYRAAMPATTW